MACYVYRNQNGNTNNTDNNNGTTILGLLQKIDRMQRNAVIVGETDECETCMLTSMFNTKPIAVYTCSRRVTATLGATEDETNLFRVEAIRGNETVVLRLLTVVDGVITCTGYTIVMDINCICYVQCFEPINCETTCFPAIG